MDRTLLLGALLAALAGCAGVDERACAADGDCAAAACCHATDAVNAGHAPDCRGVVCTDDYRACTTDDSAIHPACLADRCALTKPPPCALVDGTGESRR